MTDSREKERIVKWRSEKRGCARKTLAASANGLKPKHGLKLEKLKKKSLKNNETATLLVVYLTDQSIRLLH